MALGREGKHGADAAPNSYTVGEPNRTPARRYLTVVFTPFAYRAVFRCQADRCSITTFAIRRQQLQITPDKCSPMDREIGAAGAGNCRYSVNLER